MRPSLNAVVVAHPDDEALWLSSVVTSVERIVFGFGAVFDDPGRSQARRQAVAALPLSGIVNLEIPESGVHWKSYQTQPELTLSGVRISESAVRERYESNYARLLEGLRASLTGCRDVFTHNPWGEYGHPNTFKSTARSLPCRMSSAIQSGFQTTWAPEIGPLSEALPSA